MLWFPLLLVANLLWVIVLFYAERKLSAFMQDRIGPSVVGKSGMLQAFADLLKLLQKESIQVTGADRPLFVLAPLLLFAVSFCTYAVLPISPDVAAAGHLASGVFLILAIVSLDVFGVLLAGWASNNKYALFGAMRGLSQLMSYEIPVGLSVLSVVVLSSSTDLTTIALQQSTLWHGNYLFGLKSLGLSLDSVGGFLIWNIFKMPLMLVGFVVYYIATLAECNRAPFDLPEGESELVGGFVTEYAGFKWAVFFLSEYTLQLLFSALGVTLFLGGWSSPLPNFGPIAFYDWTSGQPETWAGNLWGVFWFMAKTLLWGVSHVWIRWTFPRLRLDQLMHLCWKVLVPISLVMFILAAVWRLLMF